MALSGIIKYKIKKEEVFKMSDDSLQKLGYKQELKRELGFGGVVLFGMAMMFPVAPVVVFGAVSVVSQGHMALAYLIAVIPMSFTAYSYGQMAGAFPVAGSAYTYTRLSINPFLGFFAGWAILLDYALFPILNYIVIGFFTTELIPALPFWGVVIAAVAFVTIVNLLGIKNLSRVNNLLVIFMFIAVLYFIISCFTTVTAGPGFSGQAFFNPGEFEFPLLLAGTAIACFSFMGFDAMTTLAEEIKNPGKVLTKATIFVCFFMGGLFIIQAFFAQSVFPDFTAFTDEDSAFLDACYAAGGDNLVVFVIIAVVAGAVANAIDSQAGVSRVLYGMGRDRYIPHKIFAHLHKKTKVPTYTILICALVGVIGASFDMDAIITTINFGALTTFMFVNLSVIFHFFIKGKKRSGMNIIRYLIVPALGFLTVATLFISLQANAKIVGFIWLCVGFVCLAVATKGFKEKPKVLDI